MKINSSNYIDFFVRYYDNELSIEETGKLFHFLESNPDLEKEFYNFLSVPQLFDTSTKESFLDKKDLIKNSTYDFDLQCIDFIENQSTEEEKEKFLKIIQQNPEKDKTFQLFSSTILRADTSLIFPKRTIAPYFKRKITTYSLSAAAGLLLLAALIYTLQFYTPQNNIIQPQNIAKNIENNQGNNTPITVTKVLRPEILSQNNVEKNKNEVNKNIYHQTKIHQELPINKKIRKIQPKPFNQLAVASLSFPSVFSQKRYATQPKKLISSPQKISKPQNENKSLKDFAIQKINQISNNHIQIKTKKNQPKKIDKISIKTNKFTFKKY